MTGEPGVDYPEEKMPIDVRAESRGDNLLSFVERIENDELVLAVGEDRLRRPVRLEPGEHLELMWRGPDELRSVPAELLAVETGARPTWRVRTVGPAARGQRRAAVRAPMDFAVTLTQGERTLRGVSVDLSEGGLRCLLDDAPWAASAVEDPAVGEGHTAADGDTDGTAEARLEIGSIHQVTVWFDDRDHVTAKGEVVRHFPRADKREEVSIRFIGLPEKMEDHIRVRVFAQLRDLRARGVL
jgi:c-di-GMP-binding flagellar brake protein YcgR